MLDQFDNDDVASALETAAKTIRDALKLDTVQVIATRYDECEGETRTFSYGIGNFHARVGSAEYWVRKNHPGLEE